MSDQHLLEVFTIDSTGELALRKQLDYETRESYVFKVFVTDGRTVSLQINYFSLNKFLFFLSERLGSRQRLCPKRKRLGAPISISPIRLFRQPRFHR